jgi:hypothetical protein
MPLSMRFISIGEFILPGILPTDDFDLIFILFARFSLDMISFLFTWDIYFDFVSIYTRTPAGAAFTFPCHSRYFEIRRHVSRSTPRNFIALTQLFIISRSLPRRRKVLYSQMTNAS